MRLRCIQDVPREITKLFLKPISINIYTMVQVEMSNIYIDVGVNNGSEKRTGKNTASSEMLIKAIYVSYVYVYTLCAG